MGGIMKRMKLTSLTFIIATMALVAIPFTSGFFSKEAILEAALHKTRSSSGSARAWPC